MIVELTDRAVLSVSGPEARPFLQGLITNDVNAVGPGTAAYAALLTAQGKILFDFLIAEQDGALLMDCLRDTRDALLKRLTMYKLRAKVDLAIRDDLRVFHGAEGGTAFTDPRLVALGPRAIAKWNELVGETGLESYQAERLRLGVPEGADFGSDRMFALDGDLDELHAISFDKGCYVGQELTARMKHRGKDRKRLLVVASEDGTPLPGRDSPVTAGGHEVGAIASTYGTRGFALVRLDRLAEVGNAPLAASGVPVSVTRQAWLSP